MIDLVGENADWLHVAKGDSMARDRRLLKALVGEESPDTITARLLRGGERASAPVPLRAVTEAVRAGLLEHLAGQHDQSKHGSGGAGGESGFDISDLVPVDEEWREQTSNDLAIMETAYKKNVARVAAEVGITPEELDGKMRAATAEALAEGLPAIRVPPAALDSILNDGFKNQIETGKSGGVLDSRLRKENEWQGFGISSDDPAHHPVYGYMESKSPPPAGGAKQYGGATVVLKRETLERATYTIDDSLAAMTMGDFHPMRATGDHPVPPLAGRSAVTTLREIAKGGGSSALLQWNTGNYSGGTRPPPGEHDSAYLELQFHGGVKKGDIDHVLFDSTPSPKVRQALEKAGVTWRKR